MVAKSTVVLGGLITLMFCAASCRVGRPEQLSHKEKLPAFRNTSFGAALVGEKSVPLFLDTGASIIWPSLALEWRKISPSGSKCGWSDYDPLIEPLRQQGIDVIGRISTGSGWEKVRDAAGGYRPRPFSPPRDLEAFRSFVTQTVAHYRGTIRYWQLLDEEYMPQVWKGNAADYVRLLQVTHEAVKQADPASKVLPGSLSGGALGALIIRDLLDRGQDQTALQLYQEFYFSAPGVRNFPLPRISSTARLRTLADRRLVRYIADFVSAVLKDGEPYYDAVCLHDYNNYPSTATLRTLVRRTRQYGGRGKTKEWIMLTGIGADNTASRRQQASAVVIRSSVALSEGVNKVLWWSFQDIRGKDPINSRAGLLDASHRPKAAYFTYQALTKEAERIHLTKVECFDPSRDVEGARYVGRNGSFVVLWPTGDARTRVSLQVGSHKVRRIALVPAGSAGPLRPTEVDAPNQRLALTLESSPVLIAEEE